MDPTMPNPITYHSHPASRQDRWVIEDLLKGLRNGYFVEAGAGGMSNTRTLETEFGWTGLAVEPHPGRFEELKTHRRCILENVCLTDVETEVEFVMNHAMPGTSGIGTELSELIRNQFYSHNEDTETVRIKGYPLWELLRKHGAPRRIDYLSLDIEGAEWMALKDFPFDEYAFSCMTIERGSNDYLRLRAKLLGQGYRLVRVGGSDDFWVHPSLDYTPPIQDLLNVSFRRLIQPIKARLKSSWKSAARS
jgi:Methyltransferase FkbM domain